MNKLMMSYCWIVVEVRRFVRDFDYYVFWVENMVDGLIEELFDCKIMFFFWEKISIFLWNY